MAADIGCWLSITGGIERMVPEIADPMMESGANGAALFFDRRLGSEVESRFVSSICRASGLIRFRHSAIG